METREQYNLRQREYRKRTGNANTNKYEKTLNGFLVRKYRNMQSRVCGVQKKKAHLYKNLYLLPREDFYKWAKESKTLTKLFIEWKESNYDRKLCPSVDRINSKLGYELSNMRWITHSENSKLGNLSRYKMKI
jgi:hypothetical protein